MPRRKRAPKMTRVIVARVDVLSRRIIRAATAKTRIERDIAERWLDIELRKTPPAIRTLQQMRLLAAARGGKLRSHGGRPRDDQFADMVLRVFDGLRPFFASERATLLRMAAMRWPVWKARDDDAVLDDDESRAVASSDVAVPVSYRTATFENLKRIVRRRRVGTKPIFT